MAKKKKKPIPQKRTARPKQAAPEPKKGSKYPMLALIAGGVLVLTGAYFLYQGQKPPTRSPQQQALKVSAGFTSNRSQWFWVDTT